MADTYTQLYIHIIFAVKGRASLIPKHHKDELHRYITGIIDSKNQTVIRINSMPNHIHILMGITPDIAISDLVRDIKANSSKFINKQRWVAGRFEWQAGFAAFSYAHSQLAVVARYITNQEEHHSRQTFREEYLAFLERFDVPYNPKYVFDSDDATEARYTHRTYALRLWKWCPRACKERRSAFTTTYRPAGACCSPNRRVCGLHKYNEHTSRGDYDLERGIGIWQIYGFLRRRRRGPNRSLHRNWRRSVR